MLSDLAQSFVNMHPRCSLIFHRSTKEIPCRQHHLLWKITGRLSFLIGMDDLAPHNGTACLPFCEAANECDRQSARMGPLTASLGRRTSASLTLNLPSMEVVGHLHLRKSAIKERER